MYYTDYYGDYGNQEGMASVQTRHRGKRYNGLKNQGATCYLNSVLQCLYMTEDFRTEVEKFRPDSQNFHGQSPDLILELQKLFKKLKEVDGTTEGITRTLCISSVLEQQDVVEYYQKTLKAIGPQAARVFEGKMSNKTKCINDHISQEQHHFFTIPLPIEAEHSEVFSVVTGLDTFFQVSKLDEDNWLCCEKCRRKTETETWTEIEEFPTILTLYLKRFYFDYNQMRPVKNNCLMDIPLKLQINSIGYELYAVINHSGGITGGHYNAVIKSFEDDEWYCFDDCSVTKYHCQDLDESLHHSNLAYLLMYRKVDELHLDEKSTNELQLRCHEYCDLVTTLRQWIQDYIDEFEKSGFPTSYKEIETICLQFLEFKMTQLPEKEADKNRLEHIYKTFKGAVKAGYIEVPPGYNPTDVETEWSQLHEAINKRERLLRNEFKCVYSFHEHLVKQCSDYNLPAMSRITASSLTHPKLDEAMLSYIKDLLAWVEKNQRCILNLQWEADLSSVESHLNNHQILNQSIKLFKYNIDNAQADESQLIPANKHAYSVYLPKLNLQYNKLLKSSLDHLRNLTSLKGFAEAVDKAQIWLNERTEEEIKYDWSDDNTNMIAKKESYSDLIQDLKKMEKIVNTIQANGDKLLKEGHPAQSAIKALITALKNQWCWMPQLCHCIKTHLKENTAYFQFFADVKEEDEKIRRIQEAMKQKYMYDRTHLEQLLQDAKDEIEQLIAFKTHLDSLAIRAKNIVQLKPRNPSTPVKDNLYIQAVCDYKDKEITVHKGDMCVLLDNSKPFQWKVKSLSGKNGTVPSVCFVIPPTNNEAVESSSGLAANWQKLYGDMKSLLSWQYLIRGIQCINAWSIITLKTQDNQALAQALNDLKQHYQSFMNEDSEFFSADECKQAESAYKIATQLYNNLLQLMEQEEQDDSVFKSYVTQIKNLCLRLERFESHMVSCIRQPMDIEPITACAQEATEQKKVQTSELNDIKKDLEAMVEESKAVLATCQQQSTWAPILQKEIDITLKKMEHVNMLVSVYLEKVKSTDLQIHRTQGTEVKKYKNQLCDLHRVPANETELESNQVQPKKLRCEAEADKPVKAECRDAMTINKCRFGVHSEGGGDCCVSVVASIKEAWQTVVDQGKLHLQKVDELDRQTQAYGQSYDDLIQWIADAKQRQEEIQDKSISDKKTLNEQLAQGKKLLEEIENKKDKVNECENDATACRKAIEYHKGQLVLHKALMEPCSFRNVESVLESIIQQINILQTHYCEVFTLASQYIEFYDKHQRLEDKEKANKKLEERRKMIKMQPELEKQTQLAESYAWANAKEDSVDEVEKQKQINLQELRNHSDQEIKDKGQQKQKSLQSLNKTEEEIPIIQPQLETTEKQNSGRKGRKVEQETAEKDRKATKMKKRKAEEEIKQKSEAQQGAVKQRQKKTEDLEAFKQQAEVKLAEDSAKVEATLFQQTAEHQKEAAEEEAAKHPKAQTRTEKLRQKPEHESKEIASTSKYMITDSRSGHQYVTDDAFHREHIDQSAFDQYFTGSADILSSNMSDSRSHSSSFGSTLSYPMNPVPFIRTEVIGPVAGILDTDTLKKLSVTEAMHRNLVDTMTGQRLLEAQACTGGIIDPNTGVKFTNVDAVNKGLVDNAMLDHLRLAQKAFQGFEDSKGQIKMSAAQAFKEGWLPYEAGQRFLEVQYLTGGLIEPDVAGRLSLDDAMKKGILDAHTAQKLRDVSGYYKYLTCPKTKLNISYKDAMERSQIEEGSGLRFLEASAQSTNYLYSQYNIKDARST